MTPPLLAAWSPSPPQPFASAAEATAAASALLAASTPVAAASSSPDAEAPQPSTQRGDAAASAVTQRGNVMALLRTEVKVAVVAEQCFYVVSGHEPPNHEAR